MSFWTTSLVVLAAVALGLFIGACWAYRRVLRAVSVFGMLHPRPPRRDR
jgi:hypothetical protein